MQANGVQMQLIVIIAKLSQPLLGLVVGWLNNEKFVCCRRNRKPKIGNGPNPSDTKLVFMYPAGNSLVLHLYEK